MVKMVIILANNISPVRYDAVAPYSFKFCFKLEAHGI